MTYKLSDIERTLLSAYIDGELLPEERGEAEQLLERSDEARAYLSELRAVHLLSGSTLAVPSVAESSGSLLADKLSGQAIEVAAERAVFTKAMTIGSWSLAGVASAVTAVIVGVALSVGTPDPAPQEIAQKNRTDQPASVAGSVPVQQAIDLDTNNLLVPPMTPSDLFAFAVEGTLPIDAERGRYITLETKGRDSLAVELHANAPRGLAEELPSLDGPALAVLDSIQRVVRTSLLQYSNEQIALRNDMPSLRLGVIRSFEKAAPHLPVQIRQKLDRCRTELVAEQRAFDNTPAASPQGGSAAGGATRPAPVSYTVVAFGGIGNSSIPAPPPEDRVVLRFNESAFMVDQRELVMLQQRMQVPSFPVYFEDEDANILVNSNPAGVRFQKSPRKKATAVAASGETERNRQSFSIRHEGEFPPPPAFEYPVYHDSWLGNTEGDSVILYMNRSLLRANEAVRRADSIIQQVQKQLKRPSRKSQTNPEMKDEEQESRGTTSAGADADAQGDDSP